MEGSTHCPAASLNKKCEENKPHITEEEVDDQCDYSYLKDELLTYIDEANKSLVTKTILFQRNSNADIEHPSSEEIAKRDPSVKRNSALVKKLRNLGALQIETLIKECQSLNMTKYLSEAAVAIVEAKIKFIDIPAMVLLCTELNCTYPDFAGFLQEECIKVLSVSKNEPITNANRLRVELCFYAELSLCGVIPARQSLPVLGTALKALTADKTFNTLSLILSFCKHCGPDYAGLVPRRIRLLLDQFGKTLNTSSLLMASKQDSVRNLLVDYYKSLWQHIQNEQIKLSCYEKQNKQILEAKGELHPDRSAQVEVVRSEIQVLLNGAVTLAELLDVDLPDIPDWVMQDIVIGEKDEYTGTHIWEDEETRMFYTHLPNVKEYLGQINKQEDGKDKNLSTKESDGFKVDDTECPSKKQAFESFLKLLLKCDTKEMVDNAALEFLLYFNTKPGRNRLNITLLMVPRKSKSVLLALFARFVAILNPVVPEVASTLCQQLKSEMLRLIDKKGQVNLESKNNTMRFIAELVNFGLFAKEEAVRALRLLLCDFTHHNIEMACSLLESCGRVLYAASDTHFSTKYYLEQMMRLKIMMPLDTRYITLIETTYYSILPPEIPSILPVPNLTPMQTFIAKLIYWDLTTPGSNTSTLHLLQSLDWNNEDTVSYTISCLTSAYNINYYHIQTLAGVVSMLADFQEDVACCVIDGVIEDIRLGMEVNDTSLNQRRVSMVKYLGELYNHLLLGTSDILKVLYSLVVFGVMQDAEDVSPLDPPTCVTRIHLVLLLLNTCDLPLYKLHIRTEITYFCTYFQRYYWLKRTLPVWSKEQPFPIDIIYRFEDVLLSKCPKFTLAKSLEEATHAVVNLNLKIYSKATHENPSLGTLFEDSELSDDNSDCSDGNDLPLTKSGVEVHSKNKEESDLEFLQEFNKMVSESVKASEAPTIKRNIDISVPLNYKKAITNDNLQIVLLLKKGNKQTFKTLTLPPDHEYITSLNCRKETSRQENEQFKKLTLDINERQQD